jgi:hypothetical protein
MLRAIFVEMTGVRVDPEQVEPLDSWSSLWRFHGAKRSSGLAWCT